MIISIDPGVNFCGIAVIDMKEKFIIREVSLVMNARRFTPEEKTKEKELGTRTVKVITIYNKIIELLEKYPEINTIAIESPFYNPKTPSVFGSILEIIFCVKYAITIPRGIKLFTIEPKAVKLVFTAAGTSKKDGMKESLKSKIELSEIVLDSDVDSLTEHEIDSIAVGYTHIAKIKDALNAKLT